MYRWRKNASATEPRTELDTSVNLKAVVPWLSIAKEVAGGIPVVGGAVQGSIGALIEIVNIFDNVRGNKERQQTLIDRINTLHQILDPLISLGSLPSGPLLFRLEKLAIDISACKPTLDRLKSYSRVAEFFQKEAIKSDLDEINNAVEEAIKTFQLEGAIRQEAVLDDLVLKVDNINAKLDDQSTKLGTHVVSATFLDSSASKCLDGTRVDLLQQLYEWSYGQRHRERRVAWIHGPPGSGKSTVAQTIATKLNEEGVLAASFFFSRYHADRRNAYNVFPSIARQLARFSKEFNHHATEAREKHSGGGVLSMELQLQQLIAEPLRQIPALESKRPWVVVLDALDECDDRSAASEILDLIGLHLESLLPHIRFLITSRPEHHIKSQFQINRLDAHAHAISLYEIDRSTGADDIALYVHFELGGGWAQREGWSPDENDLQSLVDVSDGLFIYAATCIKLVKAAADKASTLRRLARSQRDGASNLKHLNNLYSQILESVRPVMDENSLEDSLDQLRRILGAVVYLRDPLDLHNLAGLLGTSEDVISTTLRPLQSVILVPEAGDEPVRFYHLSFRDFLASHPKHVPTAQKDPIHSKLFFYDQSTYDTYLSEDCFKTLKEALHFNMSGISDLTQLNADVPDLDLRMKTHLLPSARYACLRWASHLGASYPVPSSPACTQLERWAREQMMSWLESLSLLGELGQAISSLSEAEKWYQKLPSHEEDVLQLLKDGQRFVLTFFECIESGAGHIYHSALPFTPESELLSHYASPSRGAVKVVLGCSSGWHPLLWSVTGHTNTVSSVAFAPNGKQIVSGSSDNTVRMWSSETGKLLSTLQGHTSSVTSVAFSPDSKQIASGSSDNTVRVWSSETGKLLFTLQGHTRGVDSVAFSPDGKRIASGSWDNTVRMWSSETGKLLSTLQGHTNLVTSVAFSPDGKQIASGSGDTTVRMWSSETGKLLSTLQGRTSAVWSVAFSPDGKQIALGSSDSTVRMWSSETGKVLSTLQGHTSSVFSVAFSPDGKRIASGSIDKTVRMWSLETGKLLSTLQGHTDSVTSVAFSPDGKRIASGSGDNTVRMWSSETGKLLSTLQGHTHPIRLVAFSPDGKHIESQDISGQTLQWPIEAEEHADQSVSGPSNLHVNDNGWVTDESNHSFCWIPFQNRATRADAQAARGHILCLGAAEGIITILDFLSLLDNA